MYFLITMERIWRETMIGFQHDVLMRILMRLNFALRMRVRIENENEDESENF